MAISGSGTRDSVQAQSYRSYKYNSRYEINQGIIVLPLAQASGNGSPVARVRVHQPARFREIDYEAAKQGTPPLIPAPSDLTDETLLSASLEFPLPTMGADNGTLIWRAKGTMKYVENGSWDVNNGFKVGDYPVTNTPAELVALGLAAGGAAIAALEIAAGDGETIANNLPGFPTGDDYQMATYPYNFHYPSRFLVADLAEGN